MTTPVSKARRHVPVLVSLAALLFFAQHRGRSVLPILRLPRRLQHQRLRHQRARRHRRPLGRRRWQHARFPAPAAALHADRLPGRRLHRTRATSTTSETLPADTSTRPPSATDSALQRRLHEFRLSGLGRHAPARDRRPAPHHRQLSSERRHRARLPEGRPRLPHHHLSRQRHDRRLGHQRPRDHGGRLLHGRRRRARLHLDVRRVQDDRLSGRHGVVRPGDQHPRPDRRCVDARGRRRSRLPSDRQGLHRHRVPGGASRPTPSRSMRRERSSATTSTRTATSTGTSGPRRIPEREAD